MKIKATIDNLELAVYQDKFRTKGEYPPTATWGSMLKDSFSLIYTAPWLMLFPGAAIFVLILSLNLLGDGLRDLLDPRQRRL